MRVLQAMAGAHNGGAEAFFERLAIALNKTDVDQKIVIREDAARAARLLAGGVEATQLPFGGMLDFRTSSALKKIANDFKPDVVLTWMNRATRQMPKGDYVSVARLGGYYDLKYYQGCDHLIGNTQDIVDYLVKEGWPEDRAHYVPNFVSAETAEPVNRFKLETPDRAPLLLALGRLHENKAFDVLLEALSMVFNAHLWIAGEGPEELLLRRKARALGVKDRVHFLGWRQDVAALMATCDIYVCPSRHEPLGNVVIEAWAASKPVAAAASQGPKALIKDEKTGLLAEIDDAEELAVQINRLVNDMNLRQRLGEAGHAEFQEKFTEQVVVDQYLNFFKRVTEAR